MVVLDADHCRKARGLDSYVRPAHTTAQRKRVYRDSLGDGANLHHRFGGVGKDAKGGRSVCE